MKIYIIQSTYFDTKQKAIDEAKLLAAPKWQDDLGEERFIFDNPVGITIGIVELSSLGMAVSMLNGAIPPWDGEIKVTADMSLRDATNPNAEITFSIKKVVNNG